MEGKITIRLSAFADEAAKDLNGQIAALKRNGIPYTELRSVEGKNIGDFTLSEAKEYSKALAGEGIRVWALGSPLGKVDIQTDFNEYMNKVKRVCELAAVFQTDKIRVFSFFNAYSERSKVIDYLSRMVDTAKGYGVSLCHENEKEIYGDTVERVVDLKENVQGLKFVYDPANFVQTGEDASRAVETLKGGIEYYHIKDVVAATDELVPAGYGDGGIARLVGGIDSDKTLTLEPHLAPFEGYSAIDKTVMKNKFQFSDNGAAFDAAAVALKNLLARAGYAQADGGFVKL